MADGGEGTLETIFSIYPESKIFKQKVHIFKDKLHLAYWCLLEDGTAIVELANTCGLMYMDNLYPLEANTFAFGELLKSAAKNPNVKRIVACVGGSASTDGGVGALIALGAKFLDKSGKIISMGGSGLLELDKIDSSKIVERPAGGVLCLVDVNNLLLGPNGSATVYGPQKGANDSDILLLKDALHKFHEVVGKEDFNGAGAAGGTPYGLKWLWGATLASGSETVAQLVGLADAIENCDVVITGEGKFDQQSRYGKVVGKVLEIARVKNKKVMLCVGQTAINMKEENLIGVVLGHISGSAKTSMDDPIKWIEQAGIELARNA